ncbi:hypothetical protein [Streptomyces massasporeus]|uniref:hypothetical protein n=1 Tax=Streptomyces massasporeus TaxID=67324 RepID=UPI001672AF78|nr:hypothetical protein [Streptomyces massasporeus]GGV91404.1 hypothetical protein GCM10010228_81720 [Streptomyces massasporeus]
MSLESKLLGRKKIKPWGVAVLSAVSVGLPTVPAFAENSFGTYYIVTCAACAAAASFFTLHTSTKRVETERSVVLEHALEPLSCLMGKILVDPAEFEEKRDLVLKRLVETAAELAHADAASGLYWLTAEGSELHLDCVNEQATQRHFQDKFSRGAEKDSFLIEAALSAAGRSVHDVRKDPDRGRIYMADDCRSAVFMPVRAGGVQHGLLMIQAHKPGHIPKNFRDDKRFRTVVNLISVIREMKKPDVSVRATVPGQNKPPVNDPEGTSL